MLRGQVTLIGVARYVFAAENYPLRFPLRRGTAGKSTLLSSRNRLPGGPGRARALFYTGLHSQTQPFTIIAQLLPEQPPFSTAILSLTHIEDLEQLLI
jgi:hypothetical protein